MQKDKNQGQPVYEDPMGLDDKELNFGVWYITNLPRIKKIGTGILIAISILSWGYFIISFVYYIIWGMNADQAVLDDLANTDTISHQVIVARQAEAFRYSSPDVLESSDGRYDIFSQISNTNEDFAGYFDYYFRVGNTETEKQSGFILPKSSKYIYQLGFESASNIQSAELVIENFSWKRISPRPIEDWDEFYDERIDFDIIDPAFESLDDGQEDNNSLQFTLKNNTAFNYWQVDFFLAIYRNGRIIGVNQYSALELDSQEKREVTIGWPGSFTAVSEIEVIPDLNILDEDVYMDYIGDPLNSDMNRD